jgi:hypothetical protein
MNGLIDTEHVIGHVLNSRTFLTLTLTPNPNPNPNQSNRISSLPNP